MQISLTRENKSKYLFLHCSRIATFSFTSYVNGTYTQERRTEKMKRRRIKSLNSFPHNLIVQRLHLYDNQNGFRIVYILTIVAIGQSVRHDRSSV